MDDSKTLHQGAFIPSRHISRNIIVFWVLSSYILLTIFLCAINWLPPFLIAQGRSSGTTQSNSIHIKLYRRQRFFYPGTPYKPSESEVIFSGESYMIQWRRQTSAPFPEQGVPPINISLWLSGEKIQLIEYNFVTTSLEYLWDVPSWVKPDKDYLISISFDDPEGGLIRYGYGFEIARRVAESSSPAAPRISSTTPIVASMFDPPGQTPEDKDTQPKETSSSNEENNIETSGPAATSSPAEPLPSPTSNSLNNSGDDTHISSSPEQTTLSTVQTTVESGSSSDSQAPSPSTNDMSPTGSQLVEGSNTNTPSIPFIVGTSVGGIVGFALIGVLLFLYIKERRKLRTRHPGSTGGDDRLSDRTFHLNKFLASLRPGVLPAGNAPPTEGNGSTIRRSSPDMDDRTISEFRSVTGASNKSRPVRY